RVVKGGSRMATIDAKGVYYRQLNKQIKDLVAQGNDEIVLNNVNGHRYIGDGLDSNVKLIINGTPGNDMAAFTNGVEIIVNGNGQDGIANTMNDGKLVIRGHAGDALGYSMRGGEIYVKGRVGYRVGIHMKGYKDKQPTIIVGGTAGDFFGEYMAGGRLILLGLEREEGKSIIGNHVAVGMHGGVIYVRGEVEAYKVGLEVEVLPIDEADREELKEYLADYCKEFDLDLSEVMNAQFSKLIPVSSRPYGNMYAY
ncbi:MAG: glutamate synthase (NADPH) GltB3 subunit, partial [Candidatus Frackibacter sp. T328-2]